jgi:hypothetical protein
MITILHAQNRCQRDDSSAILYAKPPIMAANIAASTIVGQDE